MSKGTGFIVWLILTAFIFSVAEAKEIRYDKGTRRDPFEPLIGPHAPLGSGSVKKETFPLEGVVYDPLKDSYAVIGGDIYREGESLDGAKLLKVLPDRIILLQESNEIVIWLREEILEKNEKK